MPPVKRIYCPPGFSNAPFSRWRHDSQFMETGGLCTENGRPHWQRYAHKKCSPIVGNFHGIFLQLECQDHHVLDTGRAY
ncbi:hypothetical protein CEXT_659231 [Caerostris extrusa]|uniref:Uncharacterized protein n=1 Tax=Caerostris extrusa TaxID=172846 RepID=A0AAV4V756_CAEEX|nr:hypothetical protein CEXT_659231 [Caerostris extrusa]